MIIYFHVVAVLQIRAPSPPFLAHFSAEDKKNLTDSMMDSLSHSTLLHLLGLLNKVI